MDDVNRLITYHIKIRDTYKENDESAYILKDGTLQTSVDSSSCGVRLNIGTEYLIAGRGEQFTLCMFAMKYDNMTPVQQRGFAGEYSKGCACDLRDEECEWNVDKTCETNLGVCVPLDGKDTVPPVNCQWRASSEYIECIT